MAEVDVKASSWKTVQVGRVALFMRGIYAGRLATIIEIVDHKRVRTSNRSNRKAADHDRFLLMVPRGTTLFLVIPNRSPTLSSRLLC